MLNREFDKDDITNGWSINNFVQGTPSYIYFVHEPINKRKNYTLLDPNMYVECFNVSC